MDANQDRINVTKVFLPPLEEYEQYLARIWESNQLTNQGPMVHALEDKLKDYLGVDNFHFVTNGTVALQIALNGLGITEGEIITTPFSFVATASSILWERCTPVFVDIEANTFCIDVSKIEAAITDKTKAIMAVHVFGYPCDVEAIELRGYNYV
jgi:dTDP-4-amino-4,6-dideoxygalactose transaminase